MFKLFKYELRKTLMPKLILLGLTACLEGFFVYSCCSKDMDKATIAAILLTVLAVMGVLFIGIQSIVTLHHDMNTKQSYMLFLTPHSNYAILGAKALECTVSVLLTGLFFFGLGALDIGFMFNKFGGVKNLLDFFKQIMATAHVNISFDALSIACLTAETIISWL